MLTYCVKCRRDTENIEPKLVRTKNNRLLNNYAIKMPCLWN